MTHLTRSVFQCVDRYAATLGALVVVGLLLFAVPQASNLLWQLPSLADGPLWFVIGFHGFLGGVLLLDLWLLSACVPDPNDPTLRGWRRPMTRVLETPSRIAAVRTVGRQRVIGLVLVASGVGIGFLPEPGRGPDLSTIGTTAYAAIAFGLWFLWVRHRSWQAGSVGFVRNLFGRVLTAACITTLVGEVLWYLVDLLPGVLSNRNYSIWAFTQMSFGMLLLARLLDALYQRWRVGPLRSGVLLALTIGIGLSGHAEVGRRDPDATPPAADAWLGHLERRLAAMPDRGPILLVAASGGGARAALFTALVLEGLDRRLVDSARGADGPALADHVLLISSVSGGSLATAWFVTHPEIDELTTPRQSTASELAWRMQTIADEAVARAVPGDDAATAFAALAERCRELHGAVNGQVPMPPLPVPFNSAFADAMSTDFLAPILRGMLLPGVDRGMSLVRSWRHDFGWGERSNAGEYDGSRPLAVLNAALSEKGLTYALGFPRTSALFTAPEVRSLSEDDPTYRLGLAEMVRLSAGFPWLTPIARLRPGDGATAIHVVDGGIVDNTGMETLASLVRRLVAVAEWDADGRYPEAVRERAKRVLDTIRGRGVIVIEIDSGAKKRSLGLGAKLLPSLLEPVEALQISLDRNALRARDRALHALQLLCMAPPAPGMLRPLPMSVRFSCDHFEDVMTSWALGPQDKAAVWSTFLFEFEPVVRDLEKAFHTLRGWAGPIGDRALTPSAEVFRGALDEVQEDIEQKERARDVARTAILRPLPAGVIVEPPAPPTPTELKLAAFVARPQSGANAEQTIYLANLASAATDLLGWRIDFVSAAGTVAWELDATDGLALPGLWTAITCGPMRSPMPKDGAFTIVLRAPEGTEQDRGAAPATNDGQAWLLRPLPSLRELLDKRK